MPMNGYAHSSQTVFSPRQSAPPDSNRVSVTASSEPSAVRPGGLPEARAFPHSDSSLSGVSAVEGKRTAKPRWQDKGALRRAPQGTSQPAPGTEGERRSVSDTGSDRSPESDDDLRRSARLT